MSAWRFKRIFKNHPKTKKYERWIFARLQDEVYSIKKIKYESITSDRFAIIISCGVSFVLVITITSHDLICWYDDDIVHSIKTQLISKITEADPSEFV